MAAMPEEEPRPTEDAQATQILTIGQELRWQSVCLMVLAGLGAGYALFILRPVLVPFVLAVFITVGLSPVFDMIAERLNTRRLVAVSITFILAIGLFTLLGLLISASVASLMDDEDVKQEARARVEEVADYAIWLGLIPAEETALKDDATDESGADEQESAAAGQEEEAAGDAENAPPNAEDGQSDTNPSEALSPAQRLEAFFFEQARQAQGRVAAVTMDLVGSLTVVLIFMFFLLLGASGDVRPTTGMWPVFEAKFREYLVTKTVISFFTGIAFALVLGLFGVPLALLMGVSAFLLNYIPNVGPIIASVLPIPLILVTPELGIVGQVAAIVLSSGVQVVSGSVVEPKVMGDSFQLHPIVILLSLMVWGMIWGLVGMLLAVPLTAAIKIALERIDRTRPIAEVMAGRLDAIQIGGGETKTA